ncbi:MAG: hypothetical protein M3179_07640 [Actinomycetota bacterium]|nr:hypothetical protein [Actinomycetota bacterium]
MLAIQDETDETGRLLLEDSAPRPAQERAARAGIPMKTEKAPYRDTPSRLDGEMNVSAYEALRHDTADMLNGFAWLARHYLERDPARRSTVRALFDVTHMGLTLPLILFRRAHNAFERYGRLPSYIASIFKASRGVFSASFDMLNKRGADHNITVTDVITFADREGHLARPQTKRVCAAPTRLIERTITVILTEESGDAGQSGLGDLIAFDALWDFYQLQDSFNESFSNYRFHLNAVMEKGANLDPGELFAQPVNAAGARRTLGDLTEDLLRQANATQRSLNRLLGRSERAPALSFEDLLKLL